MFVLTGSPTAITVALFLNPLNPFHTAFMRQAFAAAQALGIKLQALEVRTSGELKGAFAAIVRTKPDALLILADRNRMMDFVARLHAALAGSRRSPCIIGEVGPFLLHSLPRVGDKL
jgi:ABC-type uncharacterized transport system substrate-binding protein